MTELHEPGAFAQGVMVDVGPGVGALVVYAREKLRGHEIEISRKEDETSRVHTDLLPRRTAGGTVYAAVFGSLPEGDYRLWHRAQPPTEVRIVGGEVAEIDWR